MHEPEDWVLITRWALLLLVVWPLQYLIVIPTVAFVAPLVAWRVWRRARRAVSEHTAVAAGTAVALGAVAYARRDDVEAATRRIWGATTAGLRRLLTPWLLGYVRPPAHPSGSQGPLTVHRR